MGKNERSLFCEIGKSSSYFNPTTCCPKTTALRKLELPLMYNSSISAKNTNWHRKLLMPLDCPSAKIINPTKCREGNNSEVAIARAHWLTTTVIILADEATESRHPDFIRNFGSLQELHARGSTIDLLWPNSPELSAYSSRNIVYGRESNLRYTERKTNIGFGNAAKTTGDRLKNIMNLTKWLK